MRRFVSLVELGVDSLHDDYRIVDHDGDGKNQCAKRKEVEAESHQVQSKERTDKRYRNGDGGNQGRT